MKKTFNKVKLVDVLEKSPLSRWRLYAQVVVSNRTSTPLATW